MRRTGMQAEPHGLAASIDCAAGERRREARRGTAQARRPRRLLDQ
ncbi:aconitate hydratase [Burkholderia thailandensis]|nr:aconitate hydratase [Burkholderia thailandensis]AOI54313.1 aconitate hydratase [Burkholderia thailandensis]AOJ53295.1 aconitate hydratase [Burkholderia thailandensis]AVR28582.1 aconitate hydratase [Burkholderia thailandensis]MDD1479525.1 aconitate hydratase [Burkholderia thailandensis]